MKIQKTDIPDVLLLTPDIYRDDRGFFMETYREEHLKQHGFDIRFVQDNLSQSKQGTVRGLHYQIEQPQDKLITVMQGEILDVAIDLRRQSETFGEYTCAKLSFENRRQMLIPKGFAHGFAVLSQQANVYYKCTDYYYPGGERGVLWNDPKLDISWEVENPIISDKDQGQPKLNEIKDEDLF